MLYNTRRKLFFQRQKSLEKKNDNDEIKAAVTEALLQVKQLERAAEQQEKQKEREELKKILVEAILEAAKQERQELDKEKREKNEAWSKMIGEEDFSEDKGIIRLKKEFCCACRILKNLIFFKPKKAEGTFFVETFVKSILYLVFLVLQLGCSIIIILQLLGGIMTVWQWYPKGWSGNVMIEAVIPIIFNLIVIFCSCVLFKLFSIIKYEVKKIDDGNFSFSFLATLLAVVSLVTPLLASLLAILLAGVPLARPLLAFFEGGI